MIINHVNAMVVGGIGIAGAAQGFLDLSKGRIQEGAQKIFLGITSAYGVQGALRLARGVFQRKVADVVQGGVQAAIGAAGSALIHGLGPQVTNIATQASPVALTGFFVAKWGVHDLVRGRYGNGLCKLLLGLGGIASASYYAYSEWVNRSTSPITLSVSQTDFLKAQRAEIEEMYASKAASGQWVKLGSGASKVVFVHPEFPDMLIKLPKNGMGKWRETAEEDLIAHHTNLEQIRSTAASFNRIVLPQSHLYQTSKGPIVVEQKLNLVDYYPGLSPDEESLRQFKQFKGRTGLCDVFLHQNKNTGILSQPGPTHIGIFDVDCRTKVG